MPCINGKPAEIVVVVTSCILKRGMISQLLEAAYTQYALDTSAQRLSLTNSFSWSEVASNSQMDYHDYKGVLTSILTRYESDVTFIEETVTRRVHPIKGIGMQHSKVKVNYGAIRMMQSPFLASHRMSATAKMSRHDARNANRSSSTGGSRA